VTDERREAERFVPPESFIVFNRKLRKPVGELVNLSTDGAMLVTEEAIKPGSNYECQMELKPPMMGCSQVHFKLECRWCRKNVTMERWESGYRLTASEEDAYLLSYLVLGFKFCDWGDPSVAEVETVEMPDRRKAVRFELTNPLPVYDSRSHVRLGTLLDVSMGGFRVTSETPIEQNEVVTCRLQLPKKLFEMEFLSLKGQCMWCREVSPGRYESGYQFVEISKQDEAVVLHLMINYGDPRHGEKKVLIVG
jgi:hypothetical protein